MKNKLLRILSAGALAASVTCAAAQAETASGQLSINTQDSFYLVYRNADMEEARLRTTVLKYGEKPAYCIEPLAEIPMEGGEGADGFSKVHYELKDFFSTEDWEALSEETRQKISLYAAFGQGYGDRSGDEWYFAASDLIWKTVDSTMTTSYWSRISDASRAIRGEENRKSNENGEKVYAAIETIQSDVDRYTKVISWSYDDQNGALQESENVISGTVKPGTVITFTDTAGVLDMYAIENSFGDNAVISGNTVTITVNNTEEKSIIFTKEDALSCYTEKPILLYSTESQKAVTAGKIDFIPMRTEIRLKAEEPVKVLKTDENGKALAGASLELYVSGKKVHSWTSGKTAEDLTEYLSGGKTGIVKETTAPSGYYCISDTEITAGEEEVIQIADTPVKAKVLKTDSSGKALAGAELALLDSQKNQLEKWTSTTVAHEITVKLNSGATYYIRELKAPSGYTLLSSDISFSIPKEKKENVIMVSVSNDRMPVKVLKKDDSGNPLENASLTLKDSKGKELHSWTSVTEPYDITAYVEEGKSYTLTEKESVKGYYISKDVTFTVESGKDVQIVEMVDEAIDLEVVKLDDSGKVLEGPKMTLTDVKTGKVIDSWTSVTEPRQVGHLVEAGGTYEVKETEWVAGVHQAVSKKFTVPENAPSEKITVSMVDESTGIAFLKTDEEGNPIAGAKLQILDSEGKVITSFTSTSDKSGVTVDDSKKKIASLLMGGKTYTLHEESAPEGYEKAEDMTFQVTGTAKKPQTVIMKDRHSSIYVKILKTSVSDSKEYLAGAEFAVYRRSDDKIAEDVNGKEAKGTTGKDGTLSFVLPYESDGYYTKELKAPEGYALNENVFDITIQASMKNSEDNPYVVHVKDRVEVFTPNTGDEMFDFRQLLILAGALIGAVVSASMILYSRMKDRSVN